jgi:hypothetical protein
MATGLSEVIPRVAGLLDFILNIIGLLLWFNWRAGGLKTAPTGIVSLAGTLQRTEVIEPQRWFSFACLLALLLIRPLIYCQVGSKVDWIATLDLTAIVLPFRSDLLSRIYLYSTLSFAVALGVVYASLFLLSVVNTKSATTDYFSRLVTLQLGWLGKLPWPMRLLLPPIAGGLLWLALSRTLVDMGILPPPRNTGHAWQIAGTIALCVIVSWKYVLIDFLALHLLNSYVYLGNSSFWIYATLTGNRFTHPLRWLRFGKVDLASAIALIAVIVGSHYASVGLARLYRQLPL